MATPSASPMGKFIEGNTVIAHLIFIILIVIVFIVLFSAGTNIMASIFQPDDPYLIKGMITATTSKIIYQDPSQSGAIPIPRSTNQNDGIEFSWSVWINITNLDNNPGSYKHIFSKGDNVNMDNGMGTPNNAPGLYIAPNSNSLVVRMNTFNMIEESITIDNIPLQSWISVVIRLDGMYFDVYINGTLSKRITLSGVPKQNNGNVYVAMTGAFNGYISNLRYYNRALEPGDILAIMKKGPDISTSSSQSNTLNNTSNLSMQWYFDKAK
jgi:hypothetical protein